MTTKTIHEIATARNALADDEFEVQAAGGGLSARVPGESIAALVTSSAIASALSYTPANAATLASLASSISAVGYSGAYSDLTGKPSLAAIATSGSLADLGGVGTGVATALAINVGSAGAPVTFNGALGTPSSGSLANCTALPVGSVTGLGSGVATFLATPSSANLAAALTDEVGSNKLVFTDSPTLVTPTLGVASATALTLSGDISAAAWTTNGIRIKGVAATFTDTTSSGTVAAAYTNVLGGNTIAASSATTFTDYCTAYIKDPVAGSNVTLSNKWSLGLEGKLKAAGAALNPTAAGVSLLTSTGGSNTGSNATSAVDLAWTLNTSGSPDVIALRVTDTARGASTKLLNIYAGASGTTSVFSVDRSGAITAAGQIDIGNNLVNCGQLRVGAPDVQIISGELRVVSSGKIGFSSGAPTLGNDTILTRGGAAATLQMGDANAAAPVAQTLQAQGSRSGTDSNVAGANLTIHPGAGTGNAAPSSLLFKTYAATTSGSGAQTLTSAWSIDGSQSLFPAGTLGTTMTNGFLNIPGAAGAASGTPTNTTGVPIYYDTTANKLMAYNGGWKTLATAFS